MQEECQIKSYLKPLKDILSANAATNSRSWFYANEVTTIYKYPKPDPNVKLVVGVISFGGGLVGSVSKSGVLTTGDVYSYWASIGILPSNMPTVIIYPVGGAVNNPSASDSATIENTIDIETIGACCPSSNLTIILYLTTNSNSSFYNVFKTAIDNSVLIDGKSYKPSIISMSWGAPEIYFSASMLNDMNTLFQYASEKGITICTATGDDGSNNGVGGTGDYADFPSSSPYVLAVGGTSLVCPNLIYDSYTIETAWSRGGGGISRVFNKPPYQKTITTTNFRSIPDIAMLADPTTGVKYRIGGKDTIVGGTSIAAPMVAAFLACIDNRKFITPLLYELPSSSFNDIASGTNGSYKAGIGYDNCSGLGSIIGHIMIANLSGGLIQVSGIEFNQTIMTLNIGQSYNIIYTIFPDNATIKTLQWTSSNEEVASVVSGVVTAISPGTTSISAKTDDGGFSKSVVVHIVEPVVRVSGIGLVQITDQTIVKGQTSQLSYNLEPANSTNKTVQWVSSNIEVASVVSGCVTAISPGTTIISVRTEDGGFSSSVVIHIVEAEVRVTGIALLQTNDQTIMKDQTLQLSHTIEPANSTNKTVKWASSNSNVASVVSGCVTAISSGTTIISAKTDDGGFSASVVVHIVEPVVNVSGIRLVQTVDQTILIGQNLQLSHTIEPANSTNKTVKWSSSNSNVASVVSGCVIAISSGTTIISAKTDDGGFSASVVVHIVEPVVHVSGIHLFPLANQTIVKGKTLQLSYVLEPVNSTNNTVQWISSNNDVASVVSGFVTAISSGTTSISVRTEDGGFFASVVINIVEQTVHVSGISFTRSDIIIKPVRPSIKIEYIITPESACDKTVSWSSSNNECVRVSDLGIIQGVNPGKAIVTAITNDGNIEARLNVTVISPIKSIQFRTTSINIMQGNGYQLNPIFLPIEADIKDLEWQSSHIRFVTVDSKGYITAIAKGRSKITATTLNMGKSASIIINVF